VYVMPLLSHGFGMLLEGVQNERGNGLYVYTYIDR
jgi:hypothetical protein